MELIESQDPEKKKLIETSDRHKRALEKEVDALTQKANKMVTNALIIGGSLALTYLLISSISSHRKKKKNKLKTQADAPEDVQEAEEEDDGPSVLSQLGTRVLNEASTILLDIAKEKLAEYLASRKQTNENS